MPSIQKLCDRMRYWCVSVSLGYDQSQRWNIYPGGECDCSSLVIHCLREAGFDTGSASYTGNMSQQLCARGWKRLPNNGRPAKGDILLNDVHHVAVYLGGGKLAQASIDERGRASGGQSGDQTGYETNIRSYYNYPWSCYLRYAGSTEQEDDMTPNDVWNAGLGQEGTYGKDDIPAWMHLSFAHYDTARLFAILGRTDDAGLGDGTSGNIYERTVNIDKRVRDMAGMLSRTDDAGTGDGTDGDLYTRVVNIDKRVREMTATIAAQAAAIEALSKALGQDPVDMADVVEQAVREKLDSLTISLSTNTITAPKTKKETE
ncbi:endolysin-like domain-containing protein [Bifidobacterium vansinderenii]|uniref:Peptidoglycan hydrolase n=1 Tax=Bifidobacterium vansinderenii TaxID=1984871 RepID=A0A229W1D6_9BIFI|nr:NlpC/P60 family protein [Bifidobacterium vansinderenii]OXN01672.1 peptidoglycan hydrolase [Bifidobacterium vansinderenii]